MYYVYGMKYRGFSLGCQPMTDFVRRIDDPNGDFYDVIMYSRELTQEEIRQYELTPLGTTGNIDGPF